jgi:hypothetical protein
MDTEKNHSIKHCGKYIAKYADIINVSCETQEDVTSSETI